jgi:hypothetical protein
MASIVDALTPQGASLEVRAFGLVPLVRVAPNPALTKGELMRYLAELAWAPDALLLNSTLDFRAGSSRALSVCAEVLGVSARVNLSLGSDGLIERVVAADRPRREGERFVERAWCGRFSEYHQFAGRWIPTRAEVAWILEGREVPVWEGCVRGWKLVDDP